MTRKRIPVIAIAAALLGGALLYLYAGHETPYGQPPLAELKQENFPPAIENAFNAAKDDVRVLLLLSPT